MPHQGDESPDDNGGGDEDGERQTCGCECRGRGRRTRWHLAAAHEHGRDQIFAAHQPIEQIGEDVRVDQNFEGLVPEEMLGRSRFPRIGSLPYLLTLAPRGWFWFQLRKNE